MTSFDIASLKRRVARALADGVKLSFKLETEIKRGDRPAAQENKAVGAPTDKAEHDRLIKDLERLEKRLAELQRENASLRAKDAGERKPGGIEPGNVVWIFGSARTGSTWLSDMMGDLESHHVWNEPLVGNLFGYFYYDRMKLPARSKGQRGKDFILGLLYKGSWLNSIRQFVLSEAEARFPEAAADGGYIAVKEPNGSIGAPLLAEALPESRLVFLIRDFRDTVSSIKEANTEGGWLHTGRKLGGLGAGGLLQRDEDAFVKSRADLYLTQAGNAKKAYDAHTGPKTLVKYEDLLSDTLGTMRRIYSELDIPVEEEELARVVEAHAWENIPDDEKGEGKRNRKAQPGAWRDELTAEQVRIVEETAAPLMKQFYPDYPDPDHTI